MKFPVIPELSPVTSTDIQSSDNGHGRITEATAARVVLGSGPILLSDQSDASVATGRVIGGYTQKQRAALRKGKSDE